MTSKSSWHESLALYEKAIARKRGFARKGKTMPFTSENGHMFSQVTWAMASNMRNR